MRKLVAGVVLAAFALPLLACGPGAGDGPPSAGAAEAAGTGRAGSGDGATGPDDADPRRTEGAPGSPGTSVPPSSPDRPVVGERPLRYVALGDSYTEGARVRVQDNWPNQLVRALDGDIPLTVAANLAASGKTSQDVIDEQLWELRSLDPEVVSLQIGVNDVIAPDIGPEEYRANVAVILDSLLTLLPPEHIFVVTTPDYTRTPRGADYGDPEVQRAAVAEVNAMIGEAAASRGIPVVDIAPISDRVAEDPSLLTADGLHPSAKQFAGWVELIAPVVREALTGE